MREADGSMSFAPDRIEVRQGEQIKFALKKDHEFMLATKEENVAHGKLMERFPEMEHDDPNGTAHAANLARYHLEIHQERRLRIRLPDPGPLSSRDARINSGQMKQYTEMRMKMLQGFDQEAALDTIRTHVRNLNLSQWARPQSGGQS